MEICKNMAPIILAYKKSCGKSYTECAQALEVSPTSLKEYAAGRGNPNAQTMEHLAKMMGVSLSLLVCGEYSADQLILVKQILDFSKILKDAPAENRHAIVQTFSALIDLFTPAEANTAPPVADDTDAASYRMPMQVQAVRVIPQNPQLFSFPICPRCECTMEREYQSYCDRCGQALDWKGFSHAKTVSSSSARGR